MKHRLHFRPASPSPYRSSLLYLLYLLYFLLLAHFFAPRKTLSHLFSAVSALFAKNHPGCGIPRLCEEKMKSQTANPIVPTARCTYRTATGRRCRLSVSDAHSSLCRQHRAEQIQEQAADHFPQLVRNFEGFQTAQGINYSLKHLYELLAQNRISPRRAAVLSYISSLLLRTLPQIDADTAAGIVYRTKPAPIDVLVAGENTDTSQASALGSASDSSTSTGVETKGKIETQAEAKPEAEPEANKDARLVSANTWDPSIPEPDPTKKPS